MVMPLPVAAAIETIGQQLSSKASSSFIELITAPLSVRAGMSMQRQQPMLLPSVETLLQLFLKGFAGKLPIDGADFSVVDPLVYALQSQGVLLDPGAATAMSKDEIKRHKEIWDRVFKTLASRPGINEWLQAWVRGTANLGEVKAGLRSNAARWEDWGWVTSHLAARPSPVETVAMLQRGLFDLESAHTNLQRQGYMFKNHRDNLIEMGKFIPPVGDLVRFAVRESFDPALVKKLGLDQEMEALTDTYFRWANAQGLGNVSIFDDAGQKHEIDFAKLYWYAHWDLPSPTQGYQFLHRLYGSSKYGPSPWLQYAKKFEKEDLSLLLKASDYSPQWRDKLEAISYSPLTRVDVRRLRVDGIIERSDVYHNYRAQGYADKEAEWLTEWTERQVSGLDPTAARKKLINQVCRKFSVGLMSKGEAEATLSKAGLKKVQIDVALFDCESAITVDLAKRTLMATKKAFMHGQLNEQETRLMLRNGGFAANRVDQYLNVWKIELFAGRRELSVSHLLELFRDGLIDEQDFVSRLTKLNFEKTAITRLLTLARLRKEKERLKVVEKLRRESEKLAKENEAAFRRRQAELVANAKKERAEQEKSLKRMLDEQENALRRFLAARSEANLRSWFKDGTIEVEDVRVTLMLKGFTPQDAQRWIDHEQKRVG